jgi:hypothetical protein
MKKKLVLLSVAVILLFSALPLSASAAAYDPVASAPKALSFSFDYPNEGSERISVHYLIPENACRFVAITGDEKISSYGFDGSYIMQFDWSVDSKDDWNYTDEWDTGDGNFIFLDVGVDIIGNGELLWFTYDDAVGKCEGAIKSKKTDDGKRARVFDFDEHQLYVRARFAYFDSESETSYCSAWSDVYSVNDSFNKTDTGFSADLTALEPPFVSNAFYGVADGNNLIYFDISLGNELANAAWAVKRAAGEDLVLKSQIRVNDGEWQYWSVEDELYPYTTGLRAFMVDDDMLNGELEFRCCFSYDGNEDAGIEAFSTPWSKSIIRTADNSFSIVKSSDKNKEEPDAGKCSLCNICPQPLGVCAFVWLTLAVIAVLIALIIVKAIRRGKKNTSSIEAAARERLEKGRAEDEARRAGMNKSAADAAASDNDEDKEKTDVQNTGEDK